MNVPGEQSLLKLIRLLTTAAANAALYGPQHLQVLRLNNQAMTELQSLLTLADEVILKIVDKLLVYNNRPVPETLPVIRLQEALKRNGISYLQIQPGIYNEELLTLINILSKSPDRPRFINSSEHLHFGQVEIRYTDTAAQSGKPVTFGDIAEQEANHVMEMYDAVRTGEPLDLTGLHYIVGGFVSSFHQQKDSFLAIAPLRSMDEYTFTHSTNICMLNIAQAKNLGIDGRLLTEIGLAALLHDVGKMFISPEILGKAGELTPAEWDLMQQHPRLGAEYLLNTPGVPRLAVITAYEHHMRYDGSGYPRPSRPWTQNLCSHMTAISDTYDAMRTHRAYDQAMELDSITTIMLNLAGTKLHPQLTHSFLQMLGSFEKSDDLS